MHIAHPTDAPTVEIVNYIDISNLKLVSIITPEFSSGTPITIYSASRKDQVKKGDILYKRDRATKTSTFFDVLTSDSIPYPTPKCSVACMQLPYQLFLRRWLVTDRERVADMNRELETAIALPY